MTEADEHDARIRREALMEADNYIGERVRLSKNHAIRLGLRALADSPRPASGLAEWYEADGSVTMLPAAEVIRLRKLAAVVLAKAHVIADEYRREVARTEGFTTAGSVLRIDDPRVALSDAFDRLDAARADRKEPQP